MKSSSKLRKALMIAGLVIAGLSGRPQCTPPVPTLTGPVSVCMNTIIVYSTDTGMLNYVFTISPDGVVLAYYGSTTTVSWPTPGVKTVCIDYTDTNGCASTTSTCLNVMVNPPILPTVTGPSPVCQGDTAVYSTDAGKNNYQWTVNGGSIIGGAGTDNITVIWGANPVDVCVNYSDTSGCLPPSPTCLPITLKPPMVPTITGPSSVAAGGSGNVYNAPSGMATYVWTCTGGIITAGQGTNSVTITWVTPGAQTVCCTFTSNSNCLSSQSFCYNVIVVNPLTITIVPTNILCNGGSTGVADLTVIGGVLPYSYNWSNTDTTEDLTNIPAGTYSVTVTDSIGSTATSSVSITQPGGLTSSIIGANVLCYGDSTGAADLTVSGGTPGYTYAWNGGPATEDLTNISAGGYTVTITDANGCSATNSIIITQPTAPLIVSVITNPVVYCIGDIAAYAITANGGTQPYSYIWSTGDTTTMIYKPVGVFYSVTVTDANGCTGTSYAIISVSAFVTSISKTNVACFGDSTGAANLTVTGGISSLTYSWSNGATTEDLTNIPAGTYIVTISDNGGCTAIDSVTINQPSVPLIVILSPVDVLCYGDSTGQIDLTINSISPYNQYLWVDGSIYDYILNIPAGTYSVTVTDSSGCTVIDSATVSQPSPFTDTIVKTNATCSTCSDGSAIATASGGTAPYSYYWNNGVTTANVTGLAPGIYHITITDVNGCTVTDSVVISFGNCLATFSIYPDTALQHHYFVVNNATGAAPVQYIWSWGDGSPNDTAAYPSHTYATSGYYDICLFITDATGCTDTYCNNFYLQKNLNDIISVDVIAPLVGIAEYAEENAISVYPNPASSLLSIELASVGAQNLVPAKTSRCKVYDILGTEVISKTFTGNKFNLDVSKLPKGLYLLKVESADKIIMKKFIKE